MTETVSFNLVDEPWILARRLDGRVTKESLRSVFEQAGELRELVGDIPTQAFAILRVLLAILERAVITADKFSDRDDPVELWGELWQSKTLPLPEIISYLDHWRYRFDLFDRETPFMQVADLRPYNPNNTEGGGLSRIIADYPNRPERALFAMRNSRGIAAMTFAEAARWLIHAQAFDTGNNKSRAANDKVNSKNARGSAGFNTGWAGKIGGVFVDGSTLKDVLLFNLELDDPDDPYSLITDKDLPCWESDPQPTAAYGDRPARGRADLYTWQSRRILLIHDETRVINVLLCPGDISNNVNTQRFEPMTIWKANSKGEYRPVVHDSSKTMWRSTTSFLSPKSPGVIRPGIVSWLCRLSSGRYNFLQAEHFIVLRGVGMSYEPKRHATVDDIVDDSLICRKELLADANVGFLDELGGWIVDTEKAIKALGALTFNLDIARGYFISDSDQRKRIERRKKREAYQIDLAYTMIDQLFRPWLASLDPPAENASQLSVYTRNKRDEWYLKARSTILMLGEMVIKEAGSQAYVGHGYSIGDKSEWMTSAQADIFFRTSLKKALPLSTDETSTNDKEKS